MAPPIGTILDIISSLMLFSLLIRENPFSSTIEHFMVATTLSYMTGSALVTYYREGIVEGMLAGEPFLIIPLILVILILARFYRPTRFLQRIPLALGIGVGIAVSTTTMIRSQFIGQLKVLINPPMTGTSAEMATYLLSTLFTLSVFCFFIFTKEFRGPLKIFPTLGRWVLLGSFGIGFGALSSYAIGRVVYKFDSLAAPGNIMYTLVIGAIIIAAMYFLGKQRSTS
jgi:hypothetical protein